jgi:hypothetical protein
MVLAKFVGEEGRDFWMWSAGNRVSAVTVSPSVTEDTISSAAEGLRKSSKNKTRATTPARNYKPDKTEPCKRIPIFPCRPFH